MIWRRWFFNSRSRIPAGLRYFSNMKSDNANTEVFSGEVDRFNGVIVELAKNTCDVNNFINRLEDSLDKWSQDKRRCIWFKVKINDSIYIPKLAEKGFNFHHARDDFVMMYKWLPQDSEPNLPPACHTNLGVGALVFNNQDKMLAISEKHYDYPHWKLPGGYVELGEEITDAAVREVREETGIESAFQSLITFRHTHNMMYGNSDIYVLLMMKALTEDIILSQREVKECKWMDVKEYTNHQHVHAFNKLVVHRALDYRRKKIKLDLQMKTVKWSKFVRNMHFLSLEEDYEYK